MTRHRRLATRRLGWLAAAVLLVTGEAGADGERPPAPRTEVDGPFAHTRIVDLTHALSKDTIFWPTEEPFVLTVEHAGETPGGYYYAANRFDTAEHGGTHLDAPIHFAEGGLAADEIPVERFIGPAVVVDVRPGDAGERDFEAGVADLEAWEARNGTIPSGAIVLFRTGWSERWPDRERYLGTARQGAEAVTELHFPGISPEAARWLVARGNVAAVGIDTASIDHGPSREFETHRTLLGAGIPAFENVARLSELPESGSFVVALPIKIRGGSGGPARIIAIIPTS